MNNIKLRKFPFPYKCGLSICSDLDGCEDISKYIEIQKFLCTNSATKIGEGIDLEVGNSFWFFRNSAKSGISYFQNLSKKETYYTPILRELIEAGIIDVIHTYGDFNNGGFERKYAEIALDEIKKKNLVINTWVNHGNRLNVQNIGNLKWFNGDNKKSSYYHMDLVKEIGIKYFWISQVTHLVGQDAKYSLNNLAKNQIQRGLALKYWRKQIPPFFSNKLLEEVKLRDNSIIKAFMRFINPWGKYSYTDINNIPYQINRTILMELIKNQGYLVLYTHLGNNSLNSTLIPENSKKHLLELAKEYYNGNIFITTTTRLLNYNEVTNGIKFKINIENGFYVIIIDGSDPNLDKNMLEGITLYTDEPEKTLVKFRDEILITQTNGKDFTGRFSISIPWIKNEFPM